MKNATKEHLVKLECPECGGPLKIVADSSLDRVCPACNINWGYKKDGTPITGMRVAPVDKVKRPPTAKQLRRRNKKARKTIDRNRNRIAKGKPKYLNGPDSSGRLTVTLESGQVVHAWLYRETDKGELLVGWTGKKEKSRVLRKNFVKRDELVKAEPTIAEDIVDTIGAAFVTPKPSVTLDDIRSGRFKASLVDGAK